MKKSKSRSMRRSSCAKPGRKARTGRHQKQASYRKPVAAALLASGSSTEPVPLKCRPLNSDGKSCCEYPGSDPPKWYPYDPVTGWDLTVECDGGGRPQ